MAIIKVPAEVPRQLASDDLRRDKQFAVILTDNTLGAGIYIIVIGGVSLFGGTTRFIITCLIRITGEPTPLAYYKALASLITLFAMRALPRSRSRKPEG